MSYTPHILVAFGGSWTAQPNEVWECTIRGMLVTGTGSEADFAGDAYLASIATPLSTWFAASTSHMRGDAVLQWVKANAIGADGKYLNPTETFVHDYSPAVAGSATVTQLPGFCSLAYTWETGNVRGTAKRGRMYPPNAFNVVGAMSVSTTDATTSVTAAIALLHVIDNAASGISTQELIPSVMSRIDGAHHPIIGASSDTLWDVQRRRKNRATGTRSSNTSYVHP